jgi:NADH dehydrogenase [ubiquinone] 1 alpha subcomplex assembly factor 7
MPVTPAQGARTGPGPHQDRRLREKVLSRVRQDGFLRLDEFLTIVLYDPSEGYYATDRELLGRAGDFRTAPEVHPLFGTTWASYVQETWEHLGRPQTLPLVELGPGRGYLLEGLLGELSRRGHPPERFPVHLVEVRRPRRGPLSHPTGPLATPIRWFRSTEDLPSFGRAVVLANEFFDALPFRRFQSVEGGWRELGVVENGGGELAWGPAAPVDLPTLERLPTGAPEGTVYDAPLAAEEALGSVLARVPEGTVVISDYGDENVSLWARHPEGSLATFHLHRAGTDPFRLLGQMDISCWVDFSSLRDVLETAGWTPGPLRSQAEGLLEEGFQERYEEWRDRVGQGTAEAVLAQLSMKTLLFGYPNHRVLVARRTSAISAPHR